MFADLPELSRAGLAPAGAPPQIWRAVDLVVGLVAVVLSAVLVGVVAVLLRAAGVAAIVTTTLGFQFVMGLVVFALAKWRGVGWRALGLVWPRTWAPLSQAWLGSYGILIGYALGLEALRRLGINVTAFADRNAVPVGSDDSLWRIAALGIAIVVLAPFTEELFFRGLLYRGMRGFWPRLPALLVSGLCFGAFHGNLGVLIPFTLVGMLFAWSNDESGSLCTSIGAHTLVNGLTFGFTVGGLGS